MTDDQLRCTEKLETFLRDSHPFPLFQLAGYAGTGKTSLLGAVVQTLQHFKIPVQLMAPTGKAAKILSQNSGKPATTIHKSIYRRKDKLADFSTLELTPNLNKVTVFIVDEASMIGDYTMSKNGNLNPRNLLEDLIEYVFSGVNCKLVLLGDIGQLPPVGSSESPALSKEYMENHFPKLQLHTAQLREVLRQELNSFILHNATQLRKNASSNIQLTTDANKDVVQISGVELQDELESAFSKNGQEETLLITRSNKRANEFNQQIRARILWMEENLCANDTLMVVKNNYHWLQDQKEIGFIANGETLQIQKIVRREKLYGFEFAKVKVVLPNYAELGEHEVIVHVESLTCEGAALSRNRVRELFFAVEEDYLYEKNKKKRYDLILANPHFNALQVKFAYAVTCHKAQGGQWDTVFIDLGYIPEDADKQELNRWLYTALTRAKEKVYLVNFPEEFMQEEL